MQSVALFRSVKLGLCEIRVLVTSSFVPVPKVAAVEFTIADRIDAVELSYSPGGPVQLDFNDGVWSTGAIHFEARWLPTCCIAIFIRANKFTRIRSE